MMRRLAVMDIGSNSIRLVIYEYLPGEAFRVIEDRKESARLSQRIDDAGRLPDDAIAYAGQILGYFKTVSRNRQADEITAVATAAIRNAANSREIIERLNRMCGLAIRVLPGTEEARLGFLGMANTMDIADGYLIDIGGGSTEITRFAGRQRVNSISLPLGAINTLKRFGSGGEFTAGNLEALQQALGGELDKLAWLKGHAGLPLVGVGGTFRNLCKMHQRGRKYSMAQHHAYRMEGSDVREMLNRLMYMPTEKRRNIDGLSKERADIIVPGAGILDFVYSYLQCSHYIACSAGVRDGLLFEKLLNGGELVDDVFEFSVRNIARLNPYISGRHSARVRRYAMQLFTAVSEICPTLPVWRKYLSAASELFQAGLSVDYYNYRQHTFYLLTQAKLYGATHREALLIALTASYKNRGRARQWMSQHADLIQKEDLAAVAKLGTLLQLAIALDRSESGRLDIRAITADRGGLAILAETAENAYGEEQELQAVKQDFRKEWNLRLQWTITPIPEAGAYLNPAPSKIRT